MLRTRLNANMVIGAAVLLALIALPMQKAIAAAQAPVTITVWTYWNQSFYRKIEQQFDASHAGIKLVFTPVALPQGQSAYPFFSGKLTAAETGGNPPNVVLNDQTTTAGWASKGLLMPIDQYLKQIGISAKDFPSTAWTSASYKGIVYGSPVDWDPDNMLYYNVDLMKKAGISSPPRTFDQLWSDAKKLTVKQKDHYVQMGFVPWDGYFFNVFGWAHLYGGTPLSPDGRILLNSPAMIKSLTWEQQWAKTYGPSAIGSFNSSVPSTMDPFIARKLGFMVDGDWELAPLRTYAPNFKFGRDWNITVAPLPSGGTSDYLASGWAWVIPNHAQNLTQTLAVVKWLSSPSVNAEWCDLIGWLPASDKILRQATTMLVKADPGFGPFIQEREAHPNLTPEFAASPNAQAVEDEGISAEDKVTHLTASPAQALNEAQRRAQAGM